MARYRGAIESHQAIKSQKKGTPGIKFVCTVREVLRGSGWEPCQWREVDATLWFPPGGDFSWNLKKLAFAGYTGGGLSSMNLSGNACELTSEIETYNGKEREKFELALPPNDGGPSEDAFLAIDAILQSSAVPAGIEAAKPGENVSPGAAPASGPSASAPAPEPEASSWDDDVPF